MICLIQAGSKIPFLTRIVTFVSPGMPDLKPQKPTDNDLTY